jgi:choline dehydrogenase-like flavoprotein
MDIRGHAEFLCSRTDNLYVVDASFFPSSAAVNPTLTIIARNAVGSRAR